MPTEMKMGCPRTPQNESEKEKITNRSQQRATNVKNLERCLRALTPKQCQIFLQNFLRCPNNTERKEMVNQLLERFGIHKRPTTQPKSTNEKLPMKQPKSKNEKVRERSPNKQILDLIRDVKKLRDKALCKEPKSKKAREKKARVHGYRLRTIKEYVATTEKRRNPTAISFQDAANETQLINKDEPVTNVKQDQRQESLDLTSAERLRTREFEWTTVKRGTKMEAAQRPTTSEMQAFIVAQPNSAQTDAPPAAKPAKKKKVPQKADEAPSQAVQRR